MVGSLFGDIIVVKNERKDDKTGKVKTFNREIRGEYVGIMDAKAYLRAPNGKLKEFDCVDVISIFDDDSKPISWDCNESSFVPKVLTEVDVKKLQKRPVLGGILIATGAIILHTYPDDPFCNECETLDDFEYYLDQKQFPSRR